MIKFECDDCRKPIANDDNHLAIPQLFIVDNKRMAQVQSLHFCCQKCCTSFLVKNAHPSNIVTLNS